MAHFFILEAPNMCSLHVFSRVRLTCVRSPAIESEKKNMNSNQSQN